MAKSTLKGYDKNNKRIVFTHIGKSRAKKIMKENQWRSGWYTNKKGKEEKL